MFSFVCLLAEFGNIGGMSNDLKSIRSTPVCVLSSVISDEIGILGGC